MSTDYFKACPNCRRQCPLAQDTCDGCGHVYRTRFDPRGRAEGDKTMIVHPSPAHVVAPPGEQIPIFCTRCRARIDPSMALCPNCGWDQRQYAQSAPPPQPQPPRQSIPLPPQTYGAPYGQQQAQMPPPLQPQQQSYQQPYQNYPGQQGQPMQQGYQSPAPVQYRSDIIQFAPGYFSTTGSVVAAIFITGVGQMCNRQTGKGVVLLLSAIIFGIATGGLAALVIWLVALIDAIQIAGRLNRGEPVGAWQWF